MPGLINIHSRTRIPLQASRASACLIGYSLGLTASLTYYNDQDVPVDAMFVYPVDESCVVVGFEALVGGRTISLQLKDGPSISREATPTTSQEQFSQDDWLYRQTAFIVDEHETREIFTVNIGSLPAYETATVLVSISSEIRNGKNGALRCTLPHICTPRFRNQSFELVTSPEDSKSSLTSTNYSMGYGTEDASFSTCRNLMDIVQETAINPFPYEFEFQLEVKMPCLLAGVESPTHSIRVDADPYARNANEVFVTLAEQHTYSEDVQVLLYLSDPHKPAIILEHGDMSLSGYEEYVKSRRSFKRLQREKEEKPSSKVDYLRGRLHKDLMHHAAIMLSFFPDFSSIPPRDPSKIPGNFIFILDRSGSMSGANIAGARETLLLFLKSLPTCCLFNIVSFGSSYKPMFSTSVAYTQQNVDKASADIKKMRADMGGTNILAPLQWVFAAPVTSGYPRQVFLLTDGSVSNTGTVIDLVRKNAYNTRCFALGIGPKASRSLVQGVGSAGGGAAELIQEGERIQPKVVACLKRALQPCISDITVTWRPPAGIEVLQSPKSLPPLFPGDRLVAYAVLYDMLVVEPRPKDEEIEETTEGSSSTVSQSTTSDFSEAASSVNTGDLLRDIVDEISSKKKEKHENELREPVRKIRKISDLGKSASMGPRSPEREFLSEVGGDENGAHIRKRGNSLEVPDLSRSNRTRKISGQGGSDIDLMMLQRMLGKLFETGGQGMEEFKVTKLSPNDQDVGPSAAEETAVKSKESAKERPQDQPSSSDADGAGSDVGAGSDADSSDSRTEDRQPKQNGVTPKGPLSPKSRDMSVDDFLTSVQKHGDWRRRAGKSKAVIKGLVFDEEFVYEIPFDVSEAIDPDRPTLDPEDNIWDETIHQLAARSIILDLEERLQRSEKSLQTEGALCPETVLDEARVKIVHTSQSANIISRYTSFSAVDEDTNEPLPSLLEQRLPLDKQPRSSNRRSGFSAGLGRRTSSMESEEDDSFHLQDTKGHAADSISLRSAPTSGFIAGRRRDSAVSSISMALPRRRSKRRQSSSQSKLFRSRFGSFGSRKLGGTPSARPLYKAYSSKSLTPEVVTLAILVDLQLACGAWRMDALLAKALGVSLEQLQRSNPMVTPKKVLNLACDSRISLQPFQTVKSHRITKKRQRQMKHGALKESGRRRHERSSPEQNGEQNGKTSSSDETMQVEKTNSVEAQDDDDENAVSREEKSRTDTDKKCTEEIHKLSEQIQKLSLDVELDEVYQKAHAQPKSRGRSMSVTICEFDRSPTSPSNLPSNQQRRKSLSDGFGPIIPFDPEGRRMQITHPKLEPIFSLALDSAEHRVAPKKPKRTSVCEANTTMATKEKGQESSENGKEPAKSEVHPPKDQEEAETRERTNSNTSTRSTGSVRFKNVDDPEAEVDRREGGSKWKYDSRRSSAFSIQSGASYTSEASQGDGARGSSGEESPCPEPEDNTESMAWATALVLCWLELKCSSYLQEWDLLAAKATTWLGDLSPQLPKGFDAGIVRTSAAQALVLLQSKDGKDGKVVNKKTQSTRL